MALYGHSKGSAGVENFVSFENHETEYVNLRAKILNGSCPTSFINAEN